MRLPVEPFLDPAAAGEMGERCQRHVDLPHVVGEGDGRQSGDPDRPVTQRPHAHHRERLAGAHDEVAVAGQERGDAGPHFDGVRERRRAARGRPATRGRRRAPAAPRPRPRGCAAVRRPRGHPRPARSTTRSGPRGRPTPAPAPTAPARRPPTCAGTGWARRRCRRRTRSSPGAAAQSLAACGSCHRSHAISAVHPARVRAIARTPAARARRGRAPRRPARPRTAPRA